MPNKDISHRTLLLSSALVVVAPLAAASVSALLGAPGSLLAAIAALALAVTWLAVQRLGMSRVSEALARLEAEHEHLLRRSENRFQQMAGVAPTGIFRLDAQFRLTYANPWCLELVGRSESDLREIGLIGCVHPEDRPWVSSIIENARALDTELVLRECRIERPDRSLVWVLVRDAVERDATGAVTGRVGTLVDISTLKETSEALRESEERFRKLARIVPVGIFRTDVDGACTYVNDALSAILRRPKHVLRGMDWRTLVHPEDVPLLDLMTGEASPRELRLRRPDGREVWALVREVVETDHSGHPLGRIGTMFDITGQIMARDALRLSEERFHVALKHSPVSVFAQDPNLRYTWIFNAPKGLEAVVGLTDEQAFNAEEAARLGLIKREVLASRCGNRCEMTVHINGEARTFDSWYEPLLDEHGTVSGLVGASVDVTEARRMQGDLMAAREQAERANEAKSRFLAAASHDLRQPFQAMRLFRAALAPHLTEPKAMAVAAKLDEAMTAGEQLLSALLDVSTLEAGIVAPKLSRIQTGDLLARLDREFQPQVTERGLKLRCHPLAAEIVTDPVLLERMLRNILHNAVRYTDRGGILLAVRRRGGRLLFQVWDTGIGISPAQQQKVFEDFYQVGNPGRDRNQGLGLGLSVVARTGRLLGHEVTLQSREGRGSVFTITVNPAPPPEEAACGPASGPEGAPQADTSAGSA